MQNDNNDNVHDYTTIKAKPVKLKKNYKYFNRNIFFRITGVILIILMKIILEWCFARIFLGFKVKNKKYIKLSNKKGKVLISNHMHPLDAILVGTVLFPRKLYVTMLLTNLGLPFVGKVFRLSGGVPIPDTKDGLSKMIGEMNREIKKGKKVLVLPEAAVRPYHVGIRKFMNGAFRFALDSEALIQPMVFIYKNPKGLRKLFKKKPCIELHFLKPVEIEILETKYQTLNNIKEKVHKIMSDYFNEHSDLKPAIEQNESN